MKKTRGIREYIALVLGLVLGLSVSVLVYETHVSGATHDDTSSSKASNQYETVDDLSWFAHDFHGEVALRERIYQASRQQLFSLLLQSNGHENSTGLSLLQSVVLERLLEEDPIATLQEITNSSFNNSHELVSKMFRQWSRTHLDQAVSQAQKLEDPWKYTAIKAIGIATADFDDSKQQDLADKLNVPTQFLDLLRSEEKVARYLDEDPHTALNLVLGDNVEDALQGKVLHRIAQSLVDLEGIQVVYDLYEMGFEWVLRCELINELLAKYSLSNPNAAFDLATSIFQQDMGVIRTSHEVRDIAIGAIAEQDPVHAMELVSEVKNIPHFEREKLWMRAIKKWAEKDPQQLKDSLPTIPQVVRFDALIFVAQHLEDDFEQALELSQQMIFHVVKEAYLTNVAKRRAQIDPLGTFEWIKNQPEFKDIHDEVLAVLVVDLAANDPDLAMNLVQTHGVQTGPNSIDELGLKVIKYVAKTDAEMALQMLPQVSVNSAADAYEEVGLAFLASGKTDRVMELGTHLSLVRQRSYYEALLRRWAVIDPSGLFESIKKLPSEESRSKAALHLIRNKWQDELSERQLKQMKRMLTREDEKELRDLSGR